MRFRFVPKSTTLDDLERRIQGLPQVFKVPAIISVTGKASDFKFGRYIHNRVHPNKRRLKIARSSLHSMAFLFYDAFGVLTMLDD